MALLISQHRLDGWDLGCSSVFSFRLATQQIVNALFDPLREGHPELVLHNHTAFGGFCYHGKKGINHAGSSAVYKLSSCMLPIGK